MPQQPKTLMRPNLFVQMQSKECQTWIENSGLQNIYTGFNC